VLLGPSWPFAPKEIPPEYVLVVPGLPSPNNTVVGAKLPGGAVLVVPYERTWFGLAADLLTGKMNGDLVRTRTWELHLGLFGTIDAFGCRSYEVDL
jgi:hypothetical protein